MQNSTKRDLFRLAFQFKSKKLWEKIADRQLFAVQLPDGRIGYCSVMGQAGVQLGLAFYIGPAGFSSFWATYEHQLDGDEMSQMLIAMERDCLGCLYDEADMLSPEELRDAKSWSRQLHMSLTRPFPYPYLSLSTPMRRMQTLTDESQAQNLLVAMNGAMYMADLVHSFMEGLHLLPNVCHPSQEVPLLVPDSSAFGGFRIERTNLPGYQEPVRPVPSPMDEITLRRLRDCPVCETWEFGITYMPGVQIDSMGPQFIPSTPVTYEPKRKVFPPITAVGDYDNKTDDMFQDYVNSIIGLQRRPSGFRIRSCDSRARAFLTPFVQQLGLPLEEADSLPNLSRAMMDYVNQNGENQDEIEEVNKALCKIIQQADLSKLRKAPPDFQMLAKSLLFDDEGKVPPAVKKKIRSCLPFWS